MTNPTSSSSTSKLSSLSTEFDKNMSRIKCLIDDNTYDSHDEIVRSDCRESIMKLTEAIDRVEREVQNFKGSIFSGGLKCSDFKDRLQKILDTATVSSEMESSSLIGLSSPISRKTESENDNNTMIIGEEEYPTTPTLDQLGLSGRTLSIVGRLGCVGSSFDSGSTTVSDGEFETSFYQNQKSPTVRNNFDNSFSSDVSVPNFNILTSSPLSTSSQSRNKSNVNALKRRKHEHQGGFKSRSNNPSNLVNVITSNSNNSSNNNNNNNNNETEDEENSFNFGNNEDSSFLECENIIKKSVHFAADDHHDLDLIKQT